MNQIKEETIYLKNKGEYLTGSIPVNAVIYKKITGIGATTLEIESHRHSIIIEPNIPVIQVKQQTHANLCGIYEDVKTTDIVNYLQDDSIIYKKLMATPESFNKIKRAFYMLDIDMYNDYFLLFDESHKLISDIDYRDTITLPMEDFWKFKRRSLISATMTNIDTYPIFKKHNFKRVTIQPTYKHSLKVNLYASNNVLQDVKQYLQTIPSEDKICFFINSVDIIIALINALKINDESNVYCADKSINKLTNKGIRNVSTKVTDLNKYNFYTSRFFSAVDIITEDKPHVCIVSDALRGHQTLIEPLLESRQIAGRLRNGISSFTHIACIDERLKYRTSKEVWANLEEQKRAYDQLNTFYNSATEEGVKQVMREALERVEISKYLEQDGSFNYFMTENLLDDEAIKSRYISFNDFVLSYSLDDEFFEIENQYSNIYPQDADKIKISIHNSRLQRKEIVDTFFSTELYKGIQTEEQQAIYDELKKKDEFIVEICENFDRNFIIEKRFNKQQLTLALIKKKTDEKLLSFPIIDAVLKSFQLEVAYTEEEIIATLNKVYTTLNVDRKAKATDIQDYFETSSRRTVVRTVKKKKAYKKGYKLLKSKFPNKSNNLSC